MYAIILLNSKLDSWKGPRRCSHCPSGAKGEKGEPGDEGQKGTRGDFGSDGVTGIGNCGSVNAFFLIVPTISPPYLSPWSEVHFPDVSIPLTGCVFTRTILTR